MAKRNDSDSDESEYNDEGINDDTFGLPDIDYKPLDTGEDDLSPPSSAANAQGDKGFSGEQTEKRYMKDKEFSHLPYEEERESSLTWLWILFLILMIGAALFLGYKYLYKGKEKGAKTEQPTPAGVEQENKDGEADKPHTEETDKAGSQQGANATTIPAGTGSIEELSVHTGRYYIVVSSSVDGDLAMDYAKKLKRKGLEVKLIKSRGRIVYTRVAIVSYATLDEARLGLDVVRQQYGNSWVLKY